RPPRALTKAIAKTAQAAAKTADATIAGVTVRRSRGALGSSTPLLEFPPGWPRTLVPFHPGRALPGSARLRRLPCRRGAAEGVDGGFTPAHGAPTPSRRLDA